MLKTVLLVAATTGYQIRSFGEAAEKLGVRLILASDRCDQLHDPWWDGAIPVRFHDRAVSVRAITEALAAVRPHGVIAVGDGPAVLAAQAAAALGLPGHPPEAAAACRNKLTSRELFARAGLPGPQFRAVPLDDDPKALADALSYPVVIKPLALSGSRGVMRVDDVGTFAGAFERLRHLLRSADVQLDRDAVHQAALIESFVPGRELAVEGVLTAGSFRTLAIFDKPDPLDGPFFEETIYVTPSREPQPVQADISETVAAAVRALGLHHGPVHAECRVGPGGVSVLEVAARPIGGLCARALRFSAGGDLVSLEEVLLRHAIGEDVSGMTREPSAAGVMMIPIPRRGVYRGVAGLQAARAVPGIEDVRITAKPETVLVPLPEGRSYLGFIFARGDDAAGVERALRTAHAQLLFAIERDIALVP